MNPQESNWKSSIIMQLVACISNRVKQNLNDYFGDKIRAVPRLLYGPRPSNKENLLKVPLFKNRVFEMLN